MKIAISELKSQENLIDIDSTASKAVVGGSTEVEVFTASYASGDLTVTQSDANVYSVEYETDFGVLSGSLGLGYSLALSFDAN